MTKKKKDNQYEKFEGWYDEHRDDWLEKMHEKWEDMNEEE